MMLQKIAVAVILYKPENIGLEQVYKNIMSYAKPIHTEYNGGIYIIDNTPLYSKERENFFKTILGSFYYHNKNQGGIAGAQNYACKKAMEDGYEWIMTMDQDSIFDEKDFNKYIAFFSEWQKKDDSAKSFAPRVYFADKSIPTVSKLIRYKILSPIKRKILKQDSKNMPKPGTPLDMHIWNGPEIEFPTRFIPASANIISLLVWKELGGFDESLIIDQVDNDFSIRLLNANYKIVRFNNVVFAHHLGETKITLFKKHKPHYNSFRLYYIFRNNFIMYKRYPKYKSVYRNELKYFFLENCVFNWIAPKNIFIFIRAYMDYKKFFK